MRLSTSSSSNWFATFMSRPPNLCVYCGQPGVTKEHFWGAWSKKLSPPRASVSVIHELRRYPSGDYHMGYKSLRGALNRPGDARSQTLKIACRSCNTGWMKQIQDNAIQPLTRLSNGDWSELSVESQRAVSNWAAMFTMSYEFADKETVNISQAARTRFSEDQSLDDDWTISIGVSLTAAKDCIGHRAMNAELEDGTVEPVQITAWDFGNLFIATICGPPQFNEKITAKLFNANMRVIRPFNSESLLKPSPCPAQNAHFLMELLTPGRD